MRRAFLSRTNHQKLSGAVQGRAVDIAVLLVLAALAGLSWRDHYDRFPRPITNPDGHDTAQIARQLASGRGMTTRFMPLNGLEYLRQQGWRGAEWPNITRFPLMVLVQAGLFAAVQGDQVIELSSTIFYALALPLVYLLGWRLGGRAAAALSGLLYVACVPLVSYSVLGLTEPAAGVLLLALLLALSPQMSARRALLAGGVFGLAVLTRYNLAVLALPAGLYILAMPNSVRRLLAFGAAAGLVVGPWAAFTAATAGAPLFNLQPASTVAFQLRPGEHVLGWYRAEYTPPLGVLLQNTQLVAGKFLREARATLPGLGHELLPFVWLLAAAWLIRPSRDALRLLAVLTGAIALQFALVNTIGYTFSRHYVFFVPAIIAFGAAAALAAARRLLAPPLALTAAAAGLALVCLPALVRQPPPLAPPIDEVARQAVLRDLPPGALVASNTPWMVAWYSDVRAIPLPPSPAGLNQIEQRYGLRIDALYLTMPGYLYDSPPEWASAWDPLRRECGPVGGFAAHPVAPGSCVYLRDSTGRQGWTQPR